MMSIACTVGEGRRLDLVQSYAWHQSCPGVAFIPGREKPEACACPHHGMTQAPRRKVSLRAKARLALLVAVLLLLAWAYLR